MADNEMIITRAGYAEAMQWLDESLAGMKVPQEEIITAELLTEDPEKVMSIYKRYFQSIG